MNQDQVAALLRTFLQLAFGILGWSSIDEDTVVALASGLALVGVTAWGIWARSNKNLVASAAAVPEVAKIVATPDVATAVPSRKVVPPGLASIALVVLAGVMLSGCVTAGPQPRTVVTTLPPTVVDARIAQVSTELARYCTLTLTALATADLFVVEPARRRVLDQARVVASAVCTEPPQDVPSALVTLARAYDGVRQVRALRPQGT